MLASIKKHCLVINVYQAYLSKCLDMVDICGNVMNLLFSWGCTRITYNFIVFHLLLLIMHSDT